MTGRGIGSASSSPRTTTTIAWPESSDGDELKKKLINDSNLDAVSKVNLLQSFLTWFNQPSSHSSSLTSATTVEDKQKSLLDYQKLVVMLNHCEEAMAKSQQMLALNQVEMKNYEDLYVRIEKGIREAHSKILHFKKQLMISDSLLAAQAVEGAEGKCHRGEGKCEGGEGKCHRGEGKCEGGEGKCEGAIEEEMSEEERKVKMEERKKTLTRLTVLEMEVKKLQMIRDDLNRKLMKRKKQCESLVATAHQLRGLFLESGRIQQAQIQSSKSSQFINANENNGWSFGFKSDSSPVFV